MKTKGFSILEVVISLTIFGILFAIITNSYQTNQLKKTQEQIIQEIVSSLEEQKSKSQTGKDGQIHTIKFYPNQFILFGGLSFDQNSSQNKTISIHSQFQISDTITNSDNILYFTKLLGDASEKATITISHIDERIPQKNIVIERTGTISVIE